MKKQTIAKLFNNYQKGLTKAIEKYQEQEEAWRYTEVALTLFTVAFFVLFAIRPAVVTISSLVGEIKEKETISLKMRGKINAIIAAQEEYALVQEKADLIDSFLPVSFNISQGLTQVIGSANQSQVSLGGISLAGVSLIGEEEVKKEKEKKEENENLSELNFSFSSKGDYFNLKQVVKMIVETRRWIDLTQYQITKSQKEEEPLSLTINGRLFYWNDNEEK